MMPTLPCGGEIVSAPLKTSCVMPHEEGTLVERFHTDDMNSYLLLLESQKIRVARKK